MSEDVNKLMCHSKIVIPRIVCEVQQDVNPAVLSSDSHPQMPSLK